MKRATTAGDRLGALITYVEDCQKRLGLDLRDQQRGDKPLGIRYLGLGKTIKIGGVPVMMCIRATTASRETSLTVDFIGPNNQPTDNWTQYVLRQRGDTRETEQRRAFATPHNPYHAILPSIATLAVDQRIIIARKPPVPGEPFGLVPASDAEIRLVEDFTLSDGVQPYYSRARSDWDDRPDLCTWPLAQRPQV